MSNPNQITIDDQVYVRADSVKAEPTTKQILILQRGWVIVGDVSKQGSDYTIKNCSVIRIWGTDKGLGQIATNGPTSKTKLDSCPDMFAHELTVVARMNVNESKWNG